MANGNNVSGARKLTQKIKADDPAASGANRHVGCLCAQPPMPIIALPRGINPDRAAAIYRDNKRWVSGTVLHYFFLERSSSPAWSWSEAEKNVVRNAFGIWKDVGIGLDFVETTRQDEAEIKIGNQHGAGSWSYVGKDAIRNSDLGRTMNFGWDLTSAWGRATALHEIGHALGLEHEHQNPNAGIVWDEDEVIAYFTGPPNHWDIQTIRHNILDKIHPSSVRGSVWRPKSLMHYEFSAAMIKAPAPYNRTGIRANFELDHTDKQVILEAYPPLSRRNIKILQVEALPAEAGGQASFIFVPDSTRDYRIQTVGISDTRVVVFEERDGTPRHHASEDDSGRDENLMLKTKLIAGRPYVITARTSFVCSPEGTGLLIS